MTGNGYIRNAKYLLRERSPETMIRSMNVVKVSVI